jgi:hypothetical protein
MKMQRVLLLLTLLNLGMLAFTIVRMPRTVAAAPDLQVLRGRGLEIVDEHGKVRAAIKIFPASPARRADGSLSDPNGEVYPETVLLRLISSKGRPNVKLAATEDGSGLVLGGETDPTYVQIMSRGTTTSMTLLNKDGHEQVIKP